MYVMNLNPLNRTILPYDVPFFIFLSVYLCH